MAWLDPANFFETADIAFEIVNNKMTKFTIKSKRGTEYTCTADIYYGTHEAPARDYSLSLKSSDATIKWYSIEQDKEDHLDGSVGEDWFELKLQNSMIISGSIDGKSSGNKDKLFDIVAYPQWTA